MLRLQEDGALSVAAQATVGTSTANASFERAAASESIPMRIAYTALRTWATVQVLEVLAAQAAIPLEIVKL